MSKKDPSPPASSMMMDRARTADFGVELGAVEIAERRRQQARGNMMAAHTENLDLRQINIELEEKNEILQHQLQEVTGLARTKLIEGSALRDTIRHLRSAWEQDAPASELRQKEDSEIQATYLGLFHKNNSDAKLVDAINQKIEETKKKPRARKRPGM